MVFSFATLKNALTTTCNFRQYNYCLDHVQIPLPWNASVAKGYLQLTSFANPNWSPSTATVSYFINKFGFSPETALKASKRVSFETSEDPDSVLSFFKNHGFSNSQIHNIVRKDPGLLSCNPDRRVLPKIKFLLSKRASPSDIVHIVTISPTLLQRSLENHIILSYELLKGILQSDKQTIASLKIYLILLHSSWLQSNIKLLGDNGVPHSNIVRILNKRSSVLCSRDLRKMVVEVLQLGFNPSKIMFILAVVAKSVVSKHQWDAKIEAYKKWGWSDQATLEAFKRLPHCMLKSTNKINAVMSFWVKQLPWHPFILTKGPTILGLSLEKRVTPRASVLQVLISKGLMKKEASLYTPFTLSEKLFIERFVKRFSEEMKKEASLYTPFTLSEKLFIERFVKRFSEETAQLLGRSLGLQRRRPWLAREQGKNGLARNYFTLQLVMLLPHKPPLASKADLDGFVTASV